MSAHHGYIAYTHGCRCEVCREAKAAYMRAKRADAAARRRLVESAGDGGRYLAPIAKHGYAAYQDAGCRCPVCRASRAEREQTWPSRRRRSA